MTATVSGRPSSRKPTGAMVSSRRPSTKLADCGPGMFVIARLYESGGAPRREACARIVGGAKSAMPAMRSASSAPAERLTPRIASRMSRTRAAASPRSTGSGATTGVSRLAKPSCSEPTRIETGHRGVQLDTGGARAALVQPVAQAARDGGEHDVVDGRVQRVLDDAELGEPGGDRDEPTVRADRLVQRGGGGGADAGEQRPSRTGVRRRRGGPGSESAPSACFGSSAASTGAVLERGRGELGGGRQRTGLPPVVCRRPPGRRAGLGVEVEHHGQQVDAVGAVDEREVRLGDERPPLTAGRRRRAGPRRRTAPTAAWCGRATG